MRTQFSLPVVVLFCTLPIQSQPSRGTTLGLTVGAECSVGIVSQTASSPNSQAITFNYKLRTSGGGGQGQITVRFTANYPEGSNVDYQTVLAGPGMGLSGTTTAANARDSGIAIARFGAEGHSSRAGDSGTVQFTVNSPAGLPFEPPRPSLSIACE